MRQVAGESLDGWFWTLVLNQEKECRQVGREVGWDGFNAGMSSGGKSCNDCWSGNFTIWTPIEIALVRESGNLKAQRICLFYTNSEFEFEVDQNAAKFDSLWLISYWWGVNVGNAIRGDHVVLMVWWCFFGRLDLSPRVLPLAGAARDGVSLAPISHFSVRPHLGSISHPGPHLPPTHLAGRRFLTLNQG